MQTMSKPVQKQIAVHIRWMIRRDMPQVLAIENANFDLPWPEEDFATTLRQRNCIGLVAEHGEKVVGFAVYEIHKTKIRLLNFAVHAAFHRRGVGTALIDKMKSKLSPETGRRGRMVCEVRETNLDAQLFFRAMGFRAVSVLENFYELSPEAAYLFCYRIGGAQ
jgi:ribosomal-protein-alanine N-acetyltransferase